jgi:hypothetical protein
MPCRPISALDLSILYTQPFGFLRAACTTSGMISCSALPLILISVKGTVRDERPLY